MRAVYDKMPILLEEGFRAGTTGKMIRGLAAPAPWCGAHAV